MRSMIDIFGSYPFRQEGNVGFWCSELILSTSRTRQAVVLTTLIKSCDSCSEAMAEDGVRDPSNKKKLKHSNFEGRAVGSGWIEDHDSVLGFVDTINISSDPSPCKRPALSHLQHLKSLWERGTPPAYPIVNIAAKYISFYFKLRGQQAAGYRRDSLSSSDMQDFSSTEQKQRGFRYYCL
jgi:hypothetical protein